jgi:hypothetical protein
VSNAAVLDVGAPSGLVHVLVETTDEPLDAVAVLWRVQDSRNFWCFEAGSGSCRLSLKENGEWHRFPSVKHCHLVPNTVNALQISDDGENIRLYVNAAQVYRTTFSDRRFSEAGGVGLLMTKTERTWMRSFEAHPRDIRAPEVFDLGQSWIAAGDRVVVTDQFDGPPGNLAGHLTAAGKEWRREIGLGVFELTGKSSVKVQATVERPCPGRTAYTTEWPSIGFADVEVTVTPPGTREGMNDTGRAGLIFWQDSRNYLIVSAFIGDYPAMSIAAFFEVNGFEELYDAVWSNVGNRMHFGVPHVFRVVFDGNRFLSSINGEPVLYRAMRDVYPRCAAFHIRRVGIVANWEWGNDTGSVFQNFIGRDRR